MGKCAKCGSDGCDACGGRGCVTDCTLKEHWGEIAGKRYPLVLDEGSGRHRFKANPIVRDFMDAASAGKKFDLNTVAMKHGREEYSTKEFLEFYMLIGYSMSGLAELSYFEGYSMDCCDWKEPADQATEQKAGPKKEKTS